MGRHSMPDPQETEVGDPRPRARRRSVAGATALVRTAAGGTAVAVRSGLLSFGPSCREGTVRLKVTASTDTAPARTAAAEEARKRNITSGGRCLDIRVFADGACKRPLLTDLRRAGSPQRRRQR